MKEQQIIEILQNYKKEKERLLQGEKDFIERKIKKPRTTQEDYLSLRRHLINYDINVLNLEVQIILIDELIEEIKKTNRRN